MCWNWNNDGGVVVLGEFKASSAITSERINRFGNKEKSWLSQGMISGQLTFDTFCQLDFNKI